MVDKFLYVASYVLVSESWKWQIQNGGKKCKKLLDWYAISSFGVTDYESGIKIQKSKMADPIWRAKFKKSLDWDDIRYLGDFRVADYKSEFTI